MDRTVLLLTSALLSFPLGAAAEEGSVVVQHATEAVLVDGDELPREGLGLWRLEAESTVESKTGFVELELEEGVWLRLRESSAVKLRSESQTAVELELLSGGVALDVLRKPERTIRIALGESTLAPDGKGSYFVDADPARFAALKGKADVVAGGQAVLLKSKTSVSADGAAAPQKLAKMDDDAFAEWCEERNDEFIRSERREATVAERAIRPAR